MATKTEHAIGLWLDGIGDPGNPKWIVSRDREDDRGTLDATTVRIFDEDDHAGAMAYALELARREGKPLIETDDAGRRERTWEPGS